MDWKLFLPGWLVSRKTRAEMAKAAKVTGTASRSRSFLGGLIEIGVEAHVVDEPDIDRCFICGEPMAKGQMVLPDVTEGLGHRECFGNDREGFVKDIDTGDPLGPDDPLPTGFPYEPTPTTQGEQG